jgi:uncharacterized protein YcbX
MARTTRYLIMPPRRREGLKLYADSWRGRYVCRYSIERSERESGRAVIFRRMPIELTEIHIYPVKSLQGTRLDEARVVGGRLPGDREWLLVDDSGQFMDMRTYPQMARLHPEITADGLLVHGHRQAPLQVQRPDVRPEKVTFVPLWRRAAPVVHVTPKADEWFTRELGVEASLMSFVRDTAGLEVPWYEEWSSLQDATPFHLTSEDSLADLNGRMAAPIPINRFRSNLVVKGAEPYAEDHWKRFSIGAMSFRWVKPCTRCVATTTDQVTGERLTREPLRTLATYRRWQDQVVFGHYVVAEELEGVLRPGDRVQVSSD